MNDVNGLAGSILETKAWSYGHIQVSEDLHKIKI